MKKLILVRHGETSYTVQGKYCGHEDVPLNEAGKEQARRLRESIKGVAIDTVYSSDLTRCLQTATIVFPDKTITKHKSLREIDFGAFSGHTFKEVEKKYPGIYKTWMEDPANVKIPNGESIQDLTKRVKDAFKEITSGNPGKNVAIVSHGGPLRIMLLGLQKKGPDKFWEIEQYTTALNIVDFNKGVPKFVTVNDISHLE